MDTNLFRYLSAVEHSFTDEVTVVHLGFKSMIHGTLLFVS